MKNFLRNWSYLLFSDIITKFFGFFATIILARNLSPAGFGTYNVIIAISSIFTVIANFGMSQVITREIARKMDISGNMFFRVIIIRLIATMLAIFGVIMYYIILKPQFDEFIIIITCIITISLTAWDLAESIAFGRKLMKYSAIINSISSFLWLISLFLLPKYFFSLFNVLLILAIIDVIKVGIYFLLIKNRKYLNKVPVDLFTSKREIIKMSLPYLWLFTIGIFRTQIPIILLSQNSNQEEVGYFSVGLRFILPIIMITSTAMKALFPDLSKLYKDNITNFQNIIRYSSILIISIGSILAVIFTMISSFLIPLLFGSEYIKAVQPFNFLIWYIVIYSLDVLLGTSLSSSNKQNTLALLGTIDFIISFPVLYYFSMKGAEYLAFSYIILSLILISYHWIIFKKLLGVYFKKYSWLYLMLFWFNLALITNIQDIFSISIQITLIIITTLIFYYLPNSPLKEIPSIIMHIRKSY